VPALDPNKHVKLAMETQSDIITGAPVSLRTAHSKAASMNKRQHRQRELWALLITKQYLYACQS
jgi:hypothetical protein